MQSKSKRKWVYSNFFICLLTFFLLRKTYWGVCELTLSLEFRKWFYCHRVLKNQLIYLTTPNTLLLDNEAKLIKYCIKLVSQTNICTAKSLKLQLSISSNASHTDQNSISLFTLLFNQEYRDDYVPFTGYPVYAVVVYRVFINVFDLHQQIMIVEGSIVRGLRTI